MPAVLMPAVFVPSDAICTVVSAAIASVDNDANALGVSDCTLLPNATTPVVLNVPALVPKAITCAVVNKFNAARVSDSTLLPSATISAAVKLAALMPSAVT